MEAIVRKIEKLSTPLNVPGGPDGSMRLDELLLSLNIFGLFEAHHRIPFKKSRRVDAKNRAYL
jgi:hypothetical protein